MSVTAEHHPPTFARLKSLGERVVELSEILIVTAAEFLVIVCLVLATAVLYALLVKRLIAAPGNPVTSIDDLQEAVERVFAGVLLLMLGLELLKSLTNFFVGFRVQVEIILVVAIIAVARHIMLLNFAHTDWTEIIGAAALVLALAISYTLVRQRNAGAD